MPSRDWKAVARQVAHEEGVPPALFLRLVGAESEWDPGAKSPVGARGFTQLMPGTAHELGVNIDDPLDNLRGGARYLKQQLDRFHDPRLALAAYNAGPGAVEKYGGVPPYSETRRYVDGIMSGLGDVPMVAGKPAGRKAAAMPALAASAAPDLGSYAMSVLNDIAGGDFSPQHSLGALTEAVSAAPPPEPTVLPAPSSPATSGAQSSQGVKIAKNADRAGVSLQAPVVDFVGRIASIYGHPLTIGTGTNHNEYVKGTHRESDHWTGWAADIPSSGDALTKLGQSALIAAGAKPEWARKQKGGVFNINGRQIIFNSNVGGNHFNHLHVGLHRH